VLAEVKQGMPRGRVAEVFGIYRAQHQGLAKTPEGDGWRRVHIPSPVPGRVRPKRPGTGDAALPAQARLNPDLTLKEHHDLYEEPHCGFPPSP
jgi:hypothetical protein